MELSVLRTNVQGNWPIGYHSTELTSAKVTGFINDAQKWVCRGNLVLPSGQVISHNFSFLEQEVTRSTTTQQQKYSLPTAGSTDWTEVASGTVRRFKSEITCEIINSENYRLPLERRFKTHIENDSEFANTLGYGIPSVYCITQEYLWLYKIPDHDYNNSTAFTINFEFYGYLPPLVEDTDSNVLTNNFDEVLEYRATAMGFRFGYDADKAEYFEAKAKERLYEMIREDEDRKLTGIETGLEPDAGQSLNLNA